ncbi:unnamed protein product [Paramecium octaurelia]|uniref:Uncharacterized protein n=1 Tax=Paramecium octaurelia TaxID=43137 RepID=A0A8S1WU31_PAROT|nr:unnamed protein product [Paramecium octaurelia]
MNIDEEIQKVYVLLKNSAETLEDVLHKSFEIPVDNWSKEKPVLLFPDSGDALQDLLELMSRIDKNLDQVRVNIRQFELNKFQVIKEEEFDPRYSQPLIDYEIVQNAEQTKMNRMKSNVNRLQRQIEAYQQKYQS